MFRKTYLAAAAVAAMLPAIDAPAYAQSVPNAVYCEANRISAEKAAQTAVSNRHDLDLAVNGGLAGGGCALAFYVFMGADFGATGLACSIATAIAVAATSTPADAASVAGDAYTRVRDPACVKPLN